MLLFVGATPTVARTQTRYLISLKSSPLPQSKGEQGKCLDREESETSKVQKDPIALPHFPEI